MFSLDDLYDFAEELIEQAMYVADEDTAAIIEDAVDTAQTCEGLDEQLAEILMAFVTIEERINVPDYPVEIVLLLRTTLRGMNTGASHRRYIH
jgi:hypothetical protein